MQVFSFGFFLLAGWFAGMLLMSSATKNFEDYRKEHLGASLLQGILWLLVLAGCVAIVYVFIDSGFIGLMLGLVFAFFSAFDLFKVTEKKAQEIGVKARAEEEVKKQKEEAKRAEKQAQEERKKAYKQALAESKASNNNAE